MHNTELDDELYNQAFTAGEQLLLQRLRTDRNCSRHLMTSYEASQMPLKECIGKVAGFACAERNFGHGPYFAAELAGRLTRELGLPVDLMKRATLGAFLDDQRPEADEKFAFGYSAKVYADEEDDLD